MHDRTNCSATAKGEILTIEYDDLPDQYLFHRKFSSNQGMTIYQADPYVQAEDDSIMDGSEMLLIWQIKDDIYAEIAFESNADLWTVWYVISCLNLDS